MGIEIEGWNKLPFNEIAARLGAALKEDSETALASEAEIWLREVPQDQQASEKQRVSAPLPVCA